MKLAARPSTVRIFTRDWARARRFYGETLGLEKAFADEMLIRKSVATWRMCCQSC